MQILKSGSTAPVLSRQLGRTIMITEGATRALRNIAGSAALARDVKWMRNCEVNPITSLRMANLVAGISDGNLAARLVESPRGLLRHLIHETSLPVISGEPLSFYSGGQFLNREVYLPVNRNPRAITQRSERFIGIFHSDDETLSREDIKKMNPLDIRRMMGLRISDWYGL